MRPASRSREARPSPSTGASGLSLKRPRPTALEHPPTPAPTPDVAELAVKLALLASGAVAAASALRTAGGLRPLAADLSGGAASARPGAVPSGLLKSGLLRPSEGGLLWALVSGGEPLFESEALCEASKS